MNDTPRKLYWFLKERYARRFFETGEMYFGHCSRYEDSSLTKAQRDSEAKRGAAFEPGEMRMWSGKSPANAQEIPFSSVEFSCDLPDYFLRSLSTEHRVKMLKDLDAEAVIEFFDVPALFAAIDDAVSKQHGTGPWEVTRRMVRYVSKQEILDVYGTTERMFAKMRQGYGEQAEFRITLLPKHNYPAKRASYLLLYLEDVLRFAKRSSR